MKDCQAECPVDSNVRTTAVTNASEMTSPIFEYRVSMETGLS
jgi:hypothetical protein